MVVMDPEGLSVGELAAATGLTVRTLHHYDSLGLVCPSERTAAGHRRYLPADVEQLYRVQALRALDLSLREVAGLFATGTRADLAEVVARQVDQVRERIERERDLLAHLEVLQEGLRSRDGHDTADLITTIARTTKLNQNLRHDYREQSNRYDLTRGASPSVLDPVRRALVGAPGRVLYDVGGGTGNYAAAFRAEGWDPTVIDPSAEMRGQAEAKGLAVLAGEATALPAADQSADAVIMISMLHQVPDWRTALDEAARVLRRGGRLAVMVLAADHLEQVTWAYDLFPSTRAFALARRPTLADLTGHLPGTVAVPLWFTELALGLRQLRELLDRGEDPRASREEARVRIGDATILHWTSPGAASS
jgi:DNA-binding transcriptional MerR regulator